MDKCVPTDVSKNILNRLKQTLNNNKMILTEACAHEIYKNTMWSNETHTHTHAQCHTQNNFNIIEWELTCIDFQ